MPLLRLPKPYDFALSTERYRAFGPDLANLWHDGGLHRVVGGVEVRVEPAPGGVRVHVPERDDVFRNTSSDHVLREVRHLLGAPFDLDGFYAFARGDAVLGAIVERLRGFRPPLNPDPFETLVTSITAQQVSLFAAFAIRNRLIRRFGVRGGRAYAFPTRERLARARPATLVSLGFSLRKAEYVVGLARHEIDLAALASLADADVHARLRAIRGLGEWTADWFLARHLARPRAWAAGDLALNKAVSALYFGGTPLTTAEVRAFGARFDPFQNLAAHYLLTGARMAAAA